MHNNTYKKYYSNIVPSSTDHAGAQPVETDVSSENLPTVSHSVRIKL